MDTFIIVRLHLNLFVVFILSVTVNLLFCSENDWNIFSYVAYWERDCYVLGWKYDSSIILAKNRTLIVTDDWLPECHNILINMELFPVIQSSRPFCMMLSLSFNICHKQTTFQIRICTAIAQHSLIYKLKQKSVAND